MDINLAGINNFFPIPTLTVDGSSPAVEDTRKQKGVAKVYSTRTRVGAKSGKASFSAAGSSQSKSKNGLGSEVPDSASADKCLKDDLGNITNSMTLCPLAI